MFFLKELWCKKQQTHFICATGEPYDISEETETSVGKIIHLAIHDMGIKEIEFRLVTLMRHLRQFVNISFMLNVLWHQIRVFLRVLSLWKLFYRTVMKILSFFLWAVKIVFVKPSLFWVKFGIPVSRDPIKSYNLISSSEKKIYFFVENQTFSNLSLLTPNWYDERNHNLIFNEKFIIQI